MDWQDQGFVLSAARFGESDAILDILTERHGRHLGLMKGGMARARRAEIQTGNLVAVEWRARLTDQLGNYTLELARPYAALALDSQAALAGLAATAAVASVSLPEREPHPNVFEATRVLVEALTGGSLSIGAAVYVKWELGLIQDLGFGLDLGSCAATGVTDDLTHVSPRTGRAVSRDAAAPYGDRLLRLPGFLLGSQAGDPDGAAIGEGLRLTGHFLHQSVLGPHRREVPQARGIFVDLVTKSILNRKS
ncbi:MAG: DNA repair protein RecO [Micropepsaceae bacterium]